MDIQTELRLARERIERLKEQNELLQEQLQDERDRLAPVKFFPHEWRLTPTETKFLAALMSRDLMSKGNLMAALYLPHERDEIDSKIIEVLVCKVRAKLKPLGLRIYTRFGMGWYLDASARKRLSEMLRVAA